MDTPLIFFIHRFRARFTRLANPACVRRFLKHCEDYIEAVSKEAEYRERGQVLDMAAFEKLRRENSAIRLCFGLFEYALGIDLPEQVFMDPVFMSLYWAAADMVCWSNVSLHNPRSTPLPNCHQIRTCTATTWNKPKAIAEITL